MRWRNTSSSWGIAAILLHWLVAITVLGLFGLGLWMTGLDYYSPWYRQGPDLHRSIGILLMMVILLRLVWRMLNRTPTALPSHQHWEIRSAHVSHVLLYLLPLAVMITGYLISTADGRSVWVFDWFQVPAIYSGLDQQETIMGDVHRVLSWILIGIAAVHAAGALKHHFLDRDTTLTRMLGLSKTEEKLQ